MNNAYLKELESRSIYVIREAYWEHRDNLAVLWSMGKDSTTLVHLVRKAFLGETPIPIIHIDTTFKFRQIYEFRDTYADKWKLRLITARNEKALKDGMSFRKGRFVCCTALKTEALKQAIQRFNLKALLVAIRRDEHSIRAKERYFSLRDEESKWNYRNQPLELWTEHHTNKSDTDTHARVHPLLHWREIDIWRYIKKEKLPVVNLYFAQKGRRYRSIGCECCCQPIESSAHNIDNIIKEIRNATIPERSGRSQDKEREYMMQKLRSLGYM